ncbi:RluA family pseudouridine synthase [Lagierella sp.]|uniref:RluA family pseudouridine synthase n=1 Tax=Lagierella sp. TaxID=2849657 RepID=UPI002603D3B5|nr:RluA family pseudouridine synthase [Lagierella sp.]
MREIKVGVNDSKQRMDRFLNKYLPKAPKSLIQKYIRQKRIKLNKKRTKPDELIYEGDLIQFYIYDEVLEEYEEDKEALIYDNNLDIVYEDENVILMNKPYGKLSHAASSEDYGNNLVDELVSYLILKGDYVPRIEKSFTPAISNRLDRNTSGLIIGCKNKESLNAMNSAIANGSIEKYYLSIVKGNLKDITLKTNVKREGTKTKVIKSDIGKESISEFYNLLSNDNYSLVKVNLITGRTHQIRSHLQSINHPILGDGKYGDKSLNEKFRKEFGLNRQLLHAYKIVFNELEGNLKYLNGKSFRAKLPEDFKTIAKEIFGDEYENKCK